MGTARAIKAIKKKAAKKKGHTYPYPKKKQ